MLKFATHSRDRSISSLISQDSVFFEKQIAQGIMDNPSIKKSKQRSQSFKHLRKYDLKCQTEFETTNREHTISTNEIIGHLCYSHEATTKEVTCMEVKNKSFFNTTKRRRRRSLSSISSLKKTSAKKIQRTVSSDAYDTMTLSPLDINESYSPPRIDPKSEAFLYKNSLKSCNSNVNGKENDRIQRNNGSCFPAKKENLNSSYYISDQNNIPLAMNPIKSQSKSWKSRIKSSLFRSNSNSNSPPSIKNTSSRSIKIVDLPFQASINTLTDKTLTKIFNFLTTDDICRLARVSRRWNSLHLNSSLWNEIFIREKPDTNMDNILNILFKKLTKYSTDQLNCLNVNTVRLENTSVTDNGLRLIALRCPNLQCFDLKNAQLVNDNGILAILENCPDICRLSFVNCRNVKVKERIDSKQVLKSVSDIRYLNFTKCSLEERGLISILRGATSLDTIRLNHCYNITDKTILKLVKFCPKLKKISIESCPQITDEGISYIFQNCVRLENIKLSNINITNACLRLFNSVLSRSLRNVELKGCKHIDDEGVKSLIAICSNIHDLNLNGCTLLTNESLYSITFLQSLCSLNLKGCININDGGIRNLATKCRHLRHLDLRMCDISVETCSYVRRKCPNCEVFVDQIVYC